VISANLKRWHLDETQRGMCAARLATLPKHIHQSDGPDGLSAPTIEQAADLFSVGETQRGMCAARLMT
jgi:hypothetical protein